MAPLCETTQENFDYEMEQATLFKPMLWDGDCNGKDEVGEMFGWVNTSHTKTISSVPPRTIRVARITHILDGSAGRRSWQKINTTPNGKSRNTLVLDSFYKDISYEDWLLNAKNKKGDAYTESGALHSTTKRLDWPY